VEVWRFINRRSNLIKHRSPHSIILRCPRLTITRREYRCRRGSHRPGCGGSTPPSCRRLCRRPPGLQALIVKFRHFAGEKCWRTARCAKSEATHHFGIRGEITIILRFERRVCRWESCRMHQFAWLVSPTEEASRSRREGCRCKSCHADQSSLSELRLGKPILECQPDKRAGPVC